MRVVGVVYLFEYVLFILLLFDYVVHLHSCKLQVSTVWPVLVSVVETLSNCVNVTLLKNQARS
jgi:hypothetical protein